MTITVTKNGRTDVYAIEGVNSIMFNQERDQQVNLVVRRVDEGDPLGMIARKHFQVDFTSEDSKNPDILSVLYERLGQLPQFVSEV